MTAHLADLLTLLAIVAVLWAMTSRLTWQRSRDARRWAARRVTDALWGSWG